jgi:hypothetical protein
MGYKDSFLLATYFSFKFSEKHAINFINFILFMFSHFHAHRNKSQL